MGHLKGRPAQRFGAAALATAGALCFSVLPASADSNPISSQEWWLNGQLNYSGAWSTAEGDGVTVAVLGSTVDATQPDLSGSLLPGVAFPADAANTDTNQHSLGCYGTQAATLIAGHGHPDSTVPGGISGVMGLAPHAQVFPVTVHQVAGGLLADPAYLAQAVRAATARHAKIIDVVFPATDSPALTSAVNDALKQGTVVVAPVGDISTTNGRPVAPADIPGTISVTAVDQSGAVPVFAGSAGRVSVAAPGVAVPAGNYAGAYTMAHQGTSCAADLVSAEAALIASAHPSWTANQIVSAIVSTASGHGHKVSAALGYGVVDPTAALAAKPGTKNPLGGPAAAATTPAAPAPPGKGSSNTLVIILVAVAGALALGGGAFFLVRKLRKGRKYSIPQAAPYLATGPTEAPNYDPGFGYDSGQYPAMPAPDSFGYQSMGGTDEQPHFDPQGYTHQAYGYEQQQPYPEQQPQQQQPAPTPESGWAPTAPYATDTYSSAQQPPVQEPPAEEGGGEAHNGQG